MKVWGKLRLAEEMAGRVAQAAADGAARRELIRQATEILLAGTHADRIGVWLETDDPADIAAGEQYSFRGLVAERGGETTPPEWTRLSPETHLPHDLLLGGKAIEQAFDRLLFQPIIGAVVGLRRAVWTPIDQRGHLRGVILAGTREKHAVLSRPVLESMASELAFAMTLSDERSLARERHADTGLAQRTLAALESGEPAEAILADLVEDCTTVSAKGSGPNAVFAVIGQVSAQDEPFGAGPGASLPREGADAAFAGAMRFAWRSGDAAWARSMEGDPFAGIWRRALAAHRVIGSEPEASWPRGEVARIVALPLEAGRQTLGILVAGLRRGASLASLERLELRAALATAALQRVHRAEDTMRREVWEKTLLDSTETAAILIDKKNNVAALSRAARELFSGALDEDTAGPASTGIIDLFAVHEREKVRAWLRSASHPADARGSAGQELEADLNVGARVRVRSASLPHAGLAALLFDPLSRNRASLEPERAETELLNVLEWLDEGVVVFDARHRIRALNSRFAQIAGLGPSESDRIHSLDDLVARLANQAADPATFAETWKKLARGLDSGVRDEVQLSRPVPRVLERSARPILGAAGQRLGHVEIYRDLTAQRVFHSKLLQTEKLAALGQTITGVAHELSNPLTSILGYAQRLLVRDTPAGRSEELKQIFQEAERASAILRQLLLSARESRPERRRVSLNQVVSRTLELQRFSLAAEKVRLEVDLDPVLPFILGDAGQLQQVLMNLIANARQAMEGAGKGGTIRVRTSRTAERRVLLEVADDGPGIPPSILARIFDPFFTTKPVGVGTGLGLTIVLGIVREHGGRVDIANPPEGGAIFSVELPSAAAEELRLPALRVAPAAAAPANLPPVAEWPAVVLPVVDLRAWAGARILVVEDEPTVARLIADVLQEDGFRVDILLDGRSAYESASKEHYDVVICDMKMPAFDGQQFYKALHEAGNSLRERFLFVTGDVLSVHTREFLELNRVPHVAKPFRVEELKEKLGLVLAATHPLTTPPRATRSNAARS